jgi:hypothetical protein
VRFKAMALAIAAAALRGESVEPRVIAHLKDNANVPFQVVMLAKGMASKMFEEIGIRLDWGNSSQKAPARPVQVELVTGVPAERLPGALGFARGFGDGRIQVFYNRIAPRGTLAGPVLAHVMAHEIAHVLVGSNDHSQTGIMKAEWTASDYAEMKFRPLSFSHWDIRVIHSGLAMWAANNPRRR